MARSRWRAAACAVLLLTAFAVLVDPPAAMAGPTVAGTVTSAGLNLRTQPWGGVLDTLPGGYSGTVSCYVLASDGSYWDWIYDSRIGRSGWVYDAYLYTAGDINTQVDEFWSHHCGYFSLAAAANVSAVPTSSGGIHISWSDTNGGTAKYVLSNGNVSTADLNPGTTSYDWIGLYPGTYMCFTVAAKQGGDQAPWSAYGCTTTPSTPWCPSDGSHPTCNGTGAFQESCDHTGGCAAPVYDYDTVARDPLDNLGIGPDSDTVGVLVGARTDMGIRHWSHAQAFLDRYLADNGADYDFNSADAYTAAPGFRAEVNATVHWWVTAGQGQASAFDSGYLAFPADLNTDEWQSDDWKAAVGHGYYRVVGSRQAGGGWSVHLQLTSYYQFKAGENFTEWPVIDIEGQAVRHLVKTGFAENFREVGNGTIWFDGSGNPA